MDGTNVKIMTKNVHIWRLASKQQTNTVSRHIEEEVRLVGRKNRRLSFNLPSSDICHQHVSFRRPFPSARGSCCAYLISSYFLSSEIIDFSFPVWIFSSFFLFLSPFTLPFGGDDLLISIYLMCNMFWIYVSTWIHSNSLNGSVPWRQISLDKGEQRSQNIRRLLPQKCKIFFRHHFVVCDAEIPLIVSVALKKYFVSDSSDNISESEVLTVTRTMVTSNFLFFLTSFW